MAGINFITICLVLSLCVQIHACSNSESNRQKAVFRQIPEIAEIKPQKPVKIKLKRNSNGNYSWELTGDDAEKVIQADKKLREALD